MVSGLTVNADVLAEQAASHFTAAADLAEELTQRFRLDYRTAYRVVGRAVAAALDRGETELTGPAVPAAAEEITGTTLPVTADLLAGATRTGPAVSARDGLGGASPRRVARTRGAGAAPGGRGPAVERRPPVAERGRRGRAAGGPRPRGRPSSRAGL